MKRYLAKVLDEVKASSRSKNGKSSGS
jgi:hypothetical protein